MRKPKPLTALPHEYVRVQQAVDLGMKVRLICETPREFEAVQRVITALRVGNRVSAVYTPSDEEPSPAELERLLRGGYL